MREYLMTLIAVSLFSGIVGMISPEGDLKKYVRLLCTLCLLCAMIGPILSLFTDSDFFLGDWAEEGEEDAIDYEEIYNNALVSGGERQAEEVIHNSIVQTFSLPSDSLEISVKTKSKNESESMADVTVILHDGAIFADPQEILTHIGKMGDFRCVIVYD